MKKQKDIFLSWIVLLVSALSLLCVFYLNTREYQEINNELKTGYVQHWSLEKTLAGHLGTLCADVHSDDEQRLCHQLARQRNRLIQAKQLNQQDIEAIEHSLHTLHGINLVFLLIIPLTFAIWRTVIYIRLVQERKKLYIDLLTGAWNRRYLYHIVKREKPDYLIMLDLDNFKQINDTWGHLTGDRVLIAFTQLLRQSLRETDLVVRFGGDEFIIMLHHIGLEDAKALITRLRHITHQSITVNGQQKIQLPGFSAGLAKYHTSLEDTIGRADRYVYQIKKSGKNGAMTE